MPSTLPIDVIVPAFNAAPYLAVSLGSIVRQTFAPREIIVVDDGSTDDTAAIARSFGATVFSGPNRGVSTARNIGIRASTAPFIAFLDADDRWHPDRLERQWSVRAARPDIALIASDYALWDGVDAEGGSLGTHPIFPLLAREPIAADSFVVSRANVLAAIVRRNFVLPSSMLVDRRLFTERDLYFTAREALPESDAVFIGEDFEWLLRVLRHTDVAFVDRILVDYRIVLSSLSARRGRIRNGDVVLGGMVAARPDRYADGAAELFALEKRRMLREASIAHFRAGEVELGAARLAELGAASRTRGGAVLRMAAAIAGFAPLRPFVKRLKTLRKPAWLRAR